MEEFDESRTRVMETMNNVVWLDDPTKYRYLRESEYSTCKRTLIRMPKTSPLDVEDGKFIEVENKLIGYTVPHRIAPQLFSGTMWWLKGYDTGMPYEDRAYPQNSKNIPTESVKVIKR